MRISRWSVAVFLVGLPCGLWLTHGLWASLAYWVTLGAANFIGWYEAESTREATR